MISKEKLKAEIDKFPEEGLFINELIERLIFIEKLESRIAASENGDSLLSQEDVKNEIERLSKSNG